MPAKYPYAVKAEAYARDVIAGKILACKWIIQACQRHFDDKEKSKSKAFKYRFDREKADLICEFGELLPHIKGSKFFGLPIHLEPWQCFLLAMIFGWVRKSDGMRRFRRANIMIPRKNGKSTIAAIIGLYMLVADREAGAEVYSGATTEKQALEVFKPAQVMVQKSPDFQVGFGVVAGARAITQLGTNSSFKTLIGRPGDGASPHCAIHDEYHEHVSDEQVDTMRTGMVARSQPLQLIITTAGDNISGPCFNEFEDGKIILNGSKPGDDTFVLIYTIDQDDDWADENSLRKANPNLGVSIEIDDLIAEQQNAIQTPRKQGVFKTKHLNIWVGALNAYFDLPSWKAMADPSLSLEDFKGHRCIIGLDLASKIDIAALELLFPQDDGSYVRFGKYYLPEATVLNDPRDLYRTWRKEGWLTVCGEEVTDFSAIRDDILQMSVLYDLQEVAYDPTQAHWLVTELGKHGVKMVEFRPNLLNFSEPMKCLDALIRSKNIRNNGDPVAAWSLGNVVARETGGDNVYPLKSRSENKIDPTVALITALGRSLLAAPKKDYKIYFV